MKKLNPIEYLTGFLMGFFSGIFIENIFVLFCGLIYTWFGWNRPELAWWMLIPLIAIPLVCGLSMAKAIASLHLEDY